MKSLFNPGCALGWNGSSHYGKTLAKARIDYIDCVGPRLVALVQRMGKWSGGMNKGTREGKFSID